LVSGGGYPVLEIFPGAVDLALTDKGQPVHLEYPFGGDEQYLVV
jgi:hypothetical protein